MSLAAQDANFGRALMLRLATLRRQGLTIGPREQLEVTALAVELLTRGVISSIEEFEPYLAPALSRNSDEFGKIDTGVRKATPSPGRPLIVGDNALDNQDPPTRKRSWLLDPRLIAVLIALALVAFVSLTSPAPGPGIIGPGEITLPKQQQRWPDYPPPSYRPTVRVVVPQRKLKQYEETVVRIYEAGKARNGLPTLEDLAERLITARQLNADQLARMLSEFSGIPLGVVLDIHQVAPRRPVVARLSQALDRIETPGQEGAIGDYPIDLRSDEARERLQNDIRRVYYNYRPGLGPVEIEDSQIR